MVVTTPPPGGGTGHQSQVRPGQTFAGAAMAASGAVPGGRSWQQILSDAKQKRNILEIHIEKNKPREDNATAIGEQKPKLLTNDQLSDFIFKELQIKVNV